MEAIVFRSQDTTWLGVAEEPAWYGLERPTVFLDTTILSYVVGGASRDPLVARHQRITRIWWKRYRHRFELVLSDRVVQEMRRGSPAKSKERLQLTESIRSVVCEAHHEAFAHELLRPGALPLKAELDALHIAVAAFNSVQFLLTWNCRHLANPTIAGKVAQTCATHDLACPRVCTPETLMRVFRS
jgi:predicted nucleic acid-binding protein